MKRNKIKLTDDYVKFWDKIINGDNFSLVRYADGERLIMRGIEVTSQEGWYSPKKITRLGEDLASSLNIIDNNYYYAISCPDCDAESYYWYLLRLQTNNITFSNIWININYQQFIKNFATLKRDAIVVANKEGFGKKFGNLNILKYYSIGDQCVDFWENDARNLIRKIKDEYGKIDNLLYVIAAGPMSGLIIADLFKNNKNNCYIDFGSSLDMYIYNKQTRPYMNNESDEAKKNCWMYDPSNIKFTKLYRMKYFALLNIISIRNKAKYFIGKKIMS